MALDIVIPQQRPKAAPAENYRYDPLFPSHCPLWGEPWDILSKHIGRIEMGGCYNFWTFGRFAMVDVINHILRQTGPAHVMATTRSLNADSVTTLLNRRKDGLLLSFKMWIDPRVHRAAPEPLQLLQANFPVVVAPVHAKLALIENEQWKVDVMGSINFTSNPQPERGIIQCIESIYDTDKKIIEDEFRKGDRLKLSECER